MPVADVVVVHVLVDILRIRLGGKLRLDFYNKQNTKLKFSIIYELTSDIIVKGRILILIIKPLFLFTFSYIMNSPFTKQKKQVTYIDIKIVLNILKYVEICKH